LEITGAPIIKSFEGEDKQFCCQGCARVYQAAYDNDMLDQVVTQPRQKEKAKGEGLFQPGESKHFAIQGMWCAGCALAAENVLKSVPGIQSADVSFAAESGRLQYDPEVADPEQVLKSLDALGYHARLTEDPDEKKDSRQQEKTFLQLLTAAAFGMQIMIIYLVQLYQQYSAGQFNLPVVRHLQYLAWALATPILFIGGSSFLKGAWRALRAKTATMDTLVALGTLSAYGYSVYIALTGKGEAYFDSVAMITTFVMVGRWLEAIGGGQARKGIRQLLALQPQAAWLKSGDDWVEAKAGSLAVGQTILVKPGERVPVDATVLRGQAAVDESLLTGESTPVEKGEGDWVYAGTVVSDSPLICRVEKVMDATRLSQITALVEQTLTAKPAIQKTADKASAWFAAGILLAAVVTAVGWYLHTGASSHALINAVAVLVVACPCALGLATPLALTVSLSKAAGAGVLVRKSNALEQAGQATMLVFDKTGTLTQGKLSLVAVQLAPDAGLSEAQVISLAASAEAASEHPIAVAIRAAAGDEENAFIGEDFKNLKGMGVTAQIGERRLLIGSSRLFGDPADYPMLAKSAQEHAALGETIVWVGWDESPLAFLALRDEPNPDAKKLIEQLKENNLRIAILSGDSVATTKAIAEELGVSDFQGHCLPGDKTRAIGAWQEEGERVMMIGDGVNDAPALAQADISVTVAGGTDIAGETSDLILMRPDLLLIPWFIHYSRRVHRIIRENLGWAFAYNLLSVPLAAFGLISPVIAAGAMACSSLLVVGNSLRLRKM
jgi:heavy metal translocating P-type ATPase